ncbi:MAG: hypothetical protein HQM10_10715 [Candidatus Riflebacteria bacterium]|nr:hypothetical protein [Candidatus Riflebacteria bacterium]
MLRRPKREKVETVLSISDDGVFLVKIKGMLDENGIRELNRSLRDFEMNLKDRKPSKVQIDLTNVGFISGSSIKWIKRWKEKLLSMRLGFELTAADRLIKKILQFSGLERQH